MSIGRWFKKLFTSRSSTDEVSSRGGGYDRMTDVVRERQAARFEAEQVVNGELSEYEGPSR